MIAQLPVFLVLLLLVSDSSYAWEEMDVSPQPCPYFDPWFNCTITVDDGTTHVETNKPGCAEGSCIRTEKVANLPPGAEADFSDFKAQVRFLFCSLPSLLFVHSNIYSVSSIFILEKFPGKSMTCIKITQLVRP